MKNNRYILFICLLFEKLNGKSLLKEFLEGIVGIKIQFNGEVCDGSLTTSIAGGLK